MKLPAPPLLVVTDRNQARAPLPDILEAAFAAGCRWASLREKDLPAEEQLALARAILPIARRHGATFTIHGEALLAKAAGVDGVHLSGGADAPAARRLLGPHALIGVSVHRMDEVASVDAKLIDYVVAGPAFATQSKPGYGPSLGPEGIAAMARASTVSLVPIGGIEADNVATLMTSGAAGIAVMGGVMRAAHPGREVRRLLSAMAPVNAPSGSH